MSLLNRYIHEVGRFLPRNNREDIKAELRSSVVDTLEDRFGPDADQDQVEQVLMEFGKPRDVAASYHPQSMYLVGPGLYPLFQMVAWIVVAAVLGAQLLAFGVAVFIAGEPFSVLETLGSLVNSIPASLGWVLITFMILQYFDAKPYLEDEPWDPKALPELNPEAGSQERGNHSWADRWNPDPCPGDCISAVDWFPDHSWWGTFTPIQ